MTQKDNSSESKLKSLFSNTHTFITIIIGLLSIYLTISQILLQGDQNRLEAQFKKEQVVQNFTDQISKNLENLSLDDEAKRDVVIALLDIVTEANLKEGEVDEKYKEEIPLRIALVSDSPGMLAHIGSDSSGMVLWTDLAEKSNNVIIKKTAVEALTLISENTNEQGVIKYSIPAILNLSKGFTLPHVGSISINSIHRIIDRIENNDIDFRISDFEEEFNIIKGSLLALVTLPNFDTLSAMPSFNYLTSYFEISNNDTTVNNLATDIIKENEDALKSRMEGLISDLNATDTDKRRQARNQLAIGGQESTTFIFEILEKNPSYRIKLGLIYALSIMKSPPSIDASNAKILVQLLGDDDPTVRKYTAQLLVRLNDESSKEKILDEFKSKLNQPTNANLIYNGVIVIGDWIKRTNSTTAKQSYIDFLYNVKASLQQDSNSWSNTISQIDQLINS